MELISYFVQVIFYTVLFAIVYQLFLAGSTVYGFNRLFIWLSVLLPFALPAITLPALSEQLSRSLVITLPETIIAQGKRIQFSGSGKENIIYVVYLLVALLLLIRMIIRHLSFRHFLDKHSFEMIDGYKMYKQTGIGPGSYGRSVFLKEGTNIPSVVLQHEIAHIRQYHYIDILLLQLLQIVAWPNIALHFLGSQLKLVHEYQADKTASSSAPTYYSTQLLMQVLATKDLKIAHQFFHHPIKQRIMMLQKSKPPQRTFGSAFLATTLILLFSVTGICQKSVHPPKATVKNKVYEIVDQTPAFKGDMVAYLSNHINYPEAARQAGVEGRVGIKFIVNKNGKVEQPEVMRSSGSPLLDQEALRVVTSMPNWKPGKLKGRAVSVYFQLPISFKLD